ncbi:hypothetical protein BDZ91DRAFT_726402 [Kalaharituber pfeilii]|nr:hypothetical protein BDZ91DRAFT_726402 [Kalaharituber pfeilii]
MLRKLLFLIGIASLALSTAAPAPVSQTNASPTIFPLYVWRFFDFIQSYAQIEQDTGNLFINTAHPISTPAFYAFLEAQPENPTSRYGLLKTTSGEYGYLFPLDALNPFSSVSRRGFQSLQIGGLLYTKWGRDDTTCGPECASRALNYYNAGNETTGSWILEPQKEGQDKGIYYVKWTTGAIIPESAIIIWTEVHE